MANESRWTNKHEFIQFALEIQGQAGCETKRAETQGTQLID
jgi:hypothetical protein